MLELSKISFTVDTSQLDTAANKLAALGKAASGLSKDFKQLDKASADAAVNQKKVELAAEKVATQAAKTAEITERAEQKKAKAVKETTKAIKEAEGAQLGLVDSIERKRDLISEGWTRGESSILKMAEAMGVAGGEMERLKGLLRDIGGLASNPFDSTLGSLRSIQKEFDGLVLRAKLVEQGIELNSTQLKQFARIAAEASVAVKKMGLDPTEGAGLETYNKLLKESQDAYLQVAVANKSMLDGEKLLAKQHRDTASAKAFLVKEDERMISVVEQLNTGTNRSVSISEKAAIATANYARALKTAGVSGDEARTRLAKYSAAQQLASQKEEQRAAANLARALQPQATDVLVSLWSGQNPLTVMLQQGGQVVDLFKLSGVEASKLGNTMKAAFAGMLPSVMAVGSAVGGLLVDGVMAAGSAFTGLFTNMTMMQKASEMTKRYLVSMGDDGFTAVGKLNKIMNGLNIAMGIVAAGLVATLVSLAVAFKQITQAQDDLTRSTISVGAYLGITTKEAYELSTGLTNVGATTVDVIKVMMKLMEGGVVSADALKMVTAAALELENVGGRSAEKTAEMFNKLGEKPVETLSDYAVKSGLVNQAEILRIDTLVRMGDEISATTEATKILSKATETEAAVIYANLSSISRLWIDVKNGTSDAWGAVQEFAGSDTIVKPLVIVMQTVAVVATEVWFAVRGITESLGGLGAIVAAVMTDIKNLDTNFSMSKSVLSSIDEADKAREESYKKSVARIMQEGEFSKEALQQKAKGESALAKANSDAEKSRLAHEEAMKPWREAEKKHLADVLTRQQFIDNAIKQVNKTKKEGEQLDKNSKDYALVVEGAGREWDKANKGNKPKIDKEMESYIDIINKAVGLTSSYNNELDRLQKAREKGKITEEQYVEAVEDLIRQQPFYIAGQKEIEENIKNQTKYQNDLNKILNETSEFIRKSDKDNQKILNGYELQLELLGKTEEQQKLIRQEAELREKVAEAEFKFAERRLKIEQDFAKLKTQKGANIAEIDSEIAAAQAEIDDQRAKTLGVLYKGVAVQAAKDYYKEMQDIAKELSGAITTALFEGGQAGTKKLRDYITNIFRKKIEVWIEANILGALTGSGANGGQKNSEGGFSFVGQNFGSNVAKTVGDMGAKMIGGPMDSFGQTLINGSDKIGQFAQTIGDNIVYLDSIRAASEGKWGEAGGSALGAYLSGGNPFVAKLGGELGKAVDRFFSGGEYVKGTGSAVSVFDSAGKVTQKNMFGNSFDVQSKQADEYVAAMQSSYLTLARSLGIKNQGGAFAFGSNNSDGGKFGVNASVGSTRYATTDIKITDEALKTEAARAVFAALQGSELPDYMRKVFDGITASTASSTELNNAINYATSLKNIRETLTETRTPLQVFKDSLNDTFAVLGTTSETFKKDFVAAIDAGIGPDALATWVSASDAMKALTDEAEKLASTNKSLQDKLDILTGKQTERTIELRDATDESTKAILRQIYEQEDLKEAADKAAKAISDVSFNFEEWMKYDQLGLSNKTQYDAYMKIEDLRKKAADQYFAAQDRVTQAQQQLADALNSTVKSFEDFLSTLDNASTPTERLSTARRNFSDLTVRAQAGDTEAIGQLTTSAKTFLDLSKGYSKSIIDYRRDEAQVRIVLEQGIKAGKEQLAKLPDEIKKSSDPLKLAYEELAKATADEETARTLAIAMQADLSKSEEDLGKLYKDLLKALPKDMGEKLLTFYNDTFAAADAAKQTAQTAAKAAQDILNNLMGPTQGPRPSSGGSVPPTGGGGSSVTNTGKGIRIGDNGLMWIDDKLVWMKDIAAEANLWGNTYGKESATAKLIELGANDSILEELRKYSVGVPMFANGGDHFGGIRLVGEKGPELEATGASRIFSANQTASILGNSDMTDQLLSIVVEKLDTLNKNNTLENNTIITHVKKSAQLLDKFDQLGIATRA